MKFEYWPGTSFIHRLDVRTKIVGFVAMVVIVFLFSSPVPNAVLAVASIGLLLALGVPARSIASLFAPLTYVVVLIFVFACLSPPPGRSANSRVLVFLWWGHHLPLTVAGLAWGLTLALRILTMVALTGVVVLSTPVGDIAALMARFRLPHALTFILMTALRFIPTLQARAGQIMDAQRARGARVDDGGTIGRIRAHVSVMVPLLSTGIRMSETLSGAMLSRGYGVTKHPTVLVDLRGSWRDGVAGACLAILLTAAVVLRARGAFGL